jgi:hypothetical protein
MLVEYAARFLNALASEFAGRSYLLENPEDTIRSLVKLLLSESGDSIARRQTLAAIQKLSLRYGSPMRELTASPGGKPKR